MKLFSSGRRGGDKRFMIISGVLVTGVGGLKKGLGGWRGVRGKG